MVGAGTSKLSGTALGGWVDNKITTRESLTHAIGPPLAPLNRQHSGPVGYSELPTMSESITVGPCCSNFCMFDSLGTIDNQLQRRQHKFAVLRVLARRIPDLLWLAATLSQAASRNHLLTL